MNYKGSDISEITTMVDKAIQSNDTKIIDSVFDQNKYPNLKQEEKEKHIFTYVSLKFSLFDKGENILQYLIFDYKINLDNSLNNMKEHLDEKTQSMFQRRILNDDLHSELKVSDKFGKTMKV